jgi:hypothetical protein
MTTISRAILALVEIMREAEHGRRRRIEACEHLLDYECPTEVIDEAKAVLLSIVEDSETFVDVKLTALKLLRRCESKRVSPGRVTGNSDDIEYSRQCEINQRYDDLLKAGFDLPWGVPHGFDDLQPDTYVPLEIVSPPADFAEALKAARLRVAAEREAQAKRAAESVAAPVRKVRANREGHTENPSK